LAKEMDDDGNADDNGGEAIALQTVTHDNAIDCLTTSVTRAEENRVDQQLRVIFWC